MTQSPTRAVKLFGTDEPPAETRVLSAGPLSAELDAGNLRYICLNGREAIRAISYVVRDQYWGTYNPEIEDFEIEESNGGFAVRYTGICRGEGEEFRYSAAITGHSNGALTFEAEGMPVTDFLTNRTGFVVLHPVAGVSGFPADVLDVEDKITRTTFPELIDPKQPIMHLIDSYRDTEGSIALINDAVATYKEMYKQLGIGQ